MTDKTRSKARSASLSGTGGLPGALPLLPTTHPEQPAPSMGASANNTADQTLALILKRLDSLDEVKAAVIRMDKRYEQHFEVYERDMVHIKKEMEQNRQARNDLTLELRTTTTDLKIVRQELSVTKELNKRMETQINNMLNHQRICNIRLDGKKEDHGENLRRAVLDLGTDMGIKDLVLTDVVSAYRVGKQSQRNNRPRTILVTFSNERVRNLFFFARTTLKNNDKYKGIFVNDDVTPVTRKQRDDYRAVASIARLDGVEVRIHTDGIVLDGEKYMLTDPQTLPSKYSIQKAKTVEMGGEIYFASESSFLSNFAPAPIVEGGVVYVTAEHLYQARKCAYLGAEDKKMRVVSAPSPLAAKRIADTVMETPEWRQVRDKVMEEVVDAKFDQNQDLAEKLLNTGDIPINEATHNDHFGIGVTLLAHEIKDKSYRGSNILGKLLVAKRTTLKTAKANTQ